MEFENKAQEEEIDFIRETIDISKCEPLSETIIVNVAQNNTYEIAKEITGKKGFLSVAKFKAEESWGYMKITVDGVPKVALKATSQTLAGVFPQTEVFDQTASGRCKSNGINSLSESLDVEAAIQNYPCVTEDTGVILLAIPIFFQNSLKIEVKSTTLETDVKLFIQGGVYP